jgi:type VI secretion system secreted protein VgrG
VQRLLEDEGIYYFFQHEETKHIMVLADSITGHQTAEGYESVLYTPKERQVAGAEEHLWGMKVRKTLYPGRHTVLSGYDPTELRPRQPQFGEEASSEPAPGAQFEHYDYPGGLFDPAEAGSEATVRVQAERVECTLIEVEGNTMGLGVGDLVTLRPSGGGGEEVFPFWDAEDFGNQYLIVGATYSLSIDQYESGTVARADEPFKAIYLLLDTHTPFRPRRTAKKTCMSGPQTALVVGPTGEEIWTDSLGRVMVQFDWDRLGKRNEKSSCWVRVAQVWAGAKWGAIHIPRIGQEVIVDFLDGDPDRPIITGRLYNADNMPPYELPANQTQSGIKSRSSKGGTASNFNELRFEDKKGSEEVYLQTEKDFNILVKNNETRTVGNDRVKTVENDETTTIGNNRTETVGTNETISVHGNRTETVGGNESIAIAGGRTETVAKDETITIAGSRSETIAKNESFAIGGARSAAIGKNESVSIGGARQVDIAKNDTLTVGSSRSQSVGGSDQLQAAKKITFDSGEEILIKSGDASITLKKDGTIILKGKDITLNASGKINGKASGDIIFKGSKVSGN